MKFLTNQLLCNLFSYQRAGLEAALVLVCRAALVTIMFFSPVIAQADLNDISRIFHQTPTLNQFEVCQGGGCVVSTTTLLTATEWNAVTSIFNQPASSSQQGSAEQERQKIAQAIGVLEDLVGKKVGTSTDLAGTFNNSETPGQMDCNDEAINTTTYLRLFKANGFMPQFEVEDMRTRNFFFTGWPHTTAVIHDIKTGERYAVDSWFYDNGHAALIVPFAQWKANYQPVDSPIGKQINKLKHAQSQ